MNLCIRRESRFFYSARRITVLVDGNSAATLSNGSAVTVPVSEGKHTIGFQLGRKVKTIISVDAAGAEDAFINSWIDAFGRVHLYSSSERIKTFRS